MKKVLKSLLVLSILAGVTFGSTVAYFTSTITAADNVITTGTLMLAVDSTRAHNEVGTWNTGNGLSWDGVTPVGAPFDAYTVVYDNNGAPVALNPLEPWMYAAPGVYAPYDTTASVGVDNNQQVGNRSVWFTVRNWGSIPAKAWVSLSGEWTGLRNNTQACIDEAAAANHSLIKVQNVHFYSFSSCEDHDECENIVNGLASVGPYVRTNDPDLAAADDVAMNATLNGSSFALSSDGTTATGNPFVMDQNEFVLMRVDLNFDPNASTAESNINCYQGATYLYDVTVNGSQANAPTW